MVCAGGRCVRASSANDSARRGTFTARERRGRAQFTGRLWTARGARRRKMNGAPPRGASSFGEIRRPCDPSVRRARRDGAAEDHALRRCVRARASRTRARIPDRDRPNDPTRGSDRSIPSPPSRPSSASPSRRTTDPAPPQPSPLAPGGLDEQVTEAVLHAAFVPFGDLKDVNIPLDHQTQKNRGFGFVTFVEKCAPNDLTRFPLQPPRTVILRLARPSFLRSRARSTDLSIDRHPPRSKRIPPRPRLL